MKIIFYTVRNLFLTGKKFIANLIEICRDGQRDKNTLGSMFSLNATSSDILHSHNKAVIAGLTRNPLQICISSERELRVKPAMTISFVVVCGIKSAMTVLCYCVRQYKASFSFYHYYNVAMDNDASILVSSIDRFFGGESLDNHSFNLNQTERYIYEV